MFGALGTLLIIGLIGYRLFGRRGNSYSSQLSGLLLKAEERGIISSVQRSQIYGLSKESSSKISIKASTWIAILGGLFVVAGVSLIIAHNWDRFGPIVRILSFVLAFAALGEATIRTETRSRALQIPLEMVWFFFPLVGIGLYAQTFQLSGDPVRPFLVWLLLVLPLALLSPRKHVGVIHLVASLVTLFYGNFESGVLSLRSTNVGEWAGSSPLSWILSASIWGVAYLHNRRLLPPGHRSQLMGVGAIWIFSLMVTGHTPLEMRDEGWTFVLATSLSLLWITLPLFSKKYESATASGLMPWLGTIYGMTFFWHTDQVSVDLVSRSGMILAILLSISAVLALFLAPHGRLARNIRWAWLARSLAFASLLLSYSLITDNIQLFHAAALVANAVLAIIAISLMWHGAKFGVEWQVNGGVALLLLLLITRFIDVLGDMLKSGFGMIGAGCLLAAIAYLVERGRKRLLRMNVGTTP